VRVSFLDSKVAQMAGRLALHGVCVRVCLHVFMCMCVCGCSEMQALGFRGGVPFLRALETASCKKGCCGRCCVFKTRVYLLRLYVFVAAICICCGYLYLLRLFVFVAAISCGSKALFGMYHVGRCQKH